MSSYSNLALLLVVDDVSGSNGNDDDDDEIIPLFVDPNSLGLDCLLLLMLLPSLAVKKTGANPIMARPFTEFIVVVDKTTMMVAMVVERYMLFLICFLDQCVCQPAIDREERD